MRLVVVLFLFSICLPAQTPALQPFVRVNAKVVALTHVRVIDGTGAPERSNQTIIVNDGRIQATGNAAEVSIPQGAEVLDLANHTVIPGLVGMHEHLFYP